MKCDKQIQFRVSAESKATLKAMAKDRQCGLSDLIRYGLSAVQYGGAERTAAVHEEIRSLRFEVAELKSQFPANQRNERSSNHGQDGRSTAAISRRILQIEHKLDKLLRQGGGHE